MSVNADTAIFRRPPGERHGSRTRIGRMLTKFVLGATTTFAYVFLYIPIVALIVFSFDKSQLASSWTGFTWHWYSVLVHDSILIDALKVSAIVAVSSAFIGTAVGLLTANALVMRGFRGRTYFVGLILLPLLLPEIVLAVAFLTLLSDLHIRLGYGSLIAAHVVLTLPYATLLLFGAVSQLDPSLREAATDLGCTPFGAFIRVVLPLLMPAVLGAFLLSFSVSFGDIVMSNFLSGVGTTTLPVQVYGMLKTGVTPEINALGSVLVLATLFVVGAAGMRMIATGTRNPIVQPIGGGEA